MLYKTYRKSIRTHLPEEIGCGKLSQPITINLQVYSTIFVSDTMEVFKLFLT